MTEAGLDEPAAARYAPLQALVRALMARSAVHAATARTAPIAALILKDPGHRRPRPISSQSAPLNPEHEGQEGVVSQRRSTAQCAAYPNAESSSINSERT